MSYEILFGALVVIFAYTIKGLSGFGPALFMIPFLTILYDPTTAISVTTLLDVIAGSFLLYTVRKEVNWSFVFSIFVTFSVGALLGSLLLGNIPTFWLKKLIGVVIIGFALVILLQKNEKQIRTTKNDKKSKYPVSFLSGFMGGLISMSGPPLVIYMKLYFKKSFFRTQLIAIFFLGASWRYILYKLNNIPMDLPDSHLIIFFLIMILGMLIGRKIHLKIKELTFNRIVAVLLFIPAINLLFLS